MKVLPGATKSNTVLAWSPCGRFIAASGTGDGITVWDLVEGTPGERVLGAGHGGEEMRFCPRTSRIYVAFRTGGVWTYDPHTGEERRRTINDSTNYTNLTISADGKTIVLRRAHYANHQGEYSLGGYSIADDGSLSEVWSRPVTNESDEHFDLTFLARTANLFGRRGNLHRTNAFARVIPQTGERAGLLPLSKDVHISRWVLSPDDERVAWLAEHNLYVQRLDESAPQVLPATAGEYRRALAWAPDGHTLAFTSGSAVRLLDADTLSEVRALDWGMGKARAVCFSPDGLRAAVSTEGGKGWVTVFDLE